VWHLHLWHRFDDECEPWTGYAIQFIQEADDETSAHGSHTEDADDDGSLPRPPPPPPQLGMFSRRVAAKNVRPAGGSPKPADAARATDRLVLGVAHAAAMRHQVQYERRAAASVYSNNGRRTMRSAAVNAQAKF
jgi:hypothetical protein